VSVVAKFKCDRVEKQGQGDDAFANVWLTPVIADTDENKTWSKYTPSGSMNMGITNPAAFDQFVEGAEYLITLEMVSQPEAAET